MDLDEYKTHLKAIKNDHGENIGIKWSVPSLRPKVDYAHEPAGWYLTWVGTFIADKHYLCLREDWTGHSGGNFTRRFFSFHYGPYTGSPAHLERARPQRVIVRIDAANYHGRGFHLHEGAKDKRIYQDQLTTPVLADLTMVQFIGSVLKIRQGRSVSQAFDLKFV